MKIPTQNLIIAALAIALLFAVQKCTSVQQNSRVNTLALTDTIQYFTNALGTQTASVRTLQTNKNQLEELLLDKDRELQQLSKNFSKIHAVTKFQTLTKYDTITITFHDTIPCVFSREGIAQSKWYSLRYRADQRSIVIDTLTLPNTASLITGTKRNWFLGRETLVTEVTNTNPYVKVTQLKSAEVILPTPVQKKWYVWIGAGLVGGYLLAK